MGVGLFDRAGEDWRQLELREGTRELLEHMTARQYSDKVRFVVLFGSEARGEARLLSDVDIAVISDEPLSRKELLETHPEISLDCASIDYRIINTLVSELGSQKYLDVNYHIRQEGLVIYEG